MNTFAEVKVVNPAEPDSASLHTSQIDLPAHREDAGPIEEAWIFSGHRDAELHVDSESTLLWRKSAEMTGDSMTGDSATGSPSAPRIESRVYFRLVPN